MHVGFTPAEIDEMPMADVYLFMHAIPTVRELIYDG